MEPTTRPGDRLLVRYGAPPVPGDVVVLRLADGTVAVKRLTALDADAATAESDNRDAPGAWSGIVPLDDVLAVVRLRAWPRPWRLPAPSR